MIHGGSGSLVGSLFGLKSELLWGGGCCADGWKIMTA